MRFAAPLFLLFDSSAAGSKSTSPRAGGNGFRRRCRGQGPTGRCDELARTGATTPPAARNLTFPDSDSFRSNLNARPGTHPASTSIAVPVCVFFNNHFARERAVHKYEVPCRENHSKHPPDQADLQAVVACLGRADRKGIDGVARGKNHWV